MVKYSSRYIPLIVRLEEKIVGLLLLSYMMSVHSLSMMDLNLAGKKTETHSCDQRVKAKVLDFLLSFGYLNLSSLSTLSQEKLINCHNLTKTEAVEIFEFGKNNQSYWTGADLLKQVKDKALPIAQALYL